MRESKTKSLNLNYDSKLSVTLWPHDYVIEWKPFPRYWPFVRGIHRSPVNSPHKCQWRAALMFSLICVWINGWVNNREAGDLRRYRAHYGVTVMYLFDSPRHRGIANNSTMFRSIFPNPGDNVMRTMFQMRSEHQVKPFTAIILCHFKISNIG